MKINTDKANQKSTRKSQDEIRDEVNRMSKESDKKRTGKQSKLFEDEDIGEEDINFESDILEDVANPDLSHDLYYGMKRLMIDNLPRGKKNEQGRRFIYDEVNLFLNSGKHIDAKGRRGSDGRMAYINPQLHPAFATVIDWLRHGAIPFQLYEAFRRKNEDLGYYDKREKPVDAEYEEGAFNQQLKALLSVPPPRKDKEDEK